MNTAIIIQTLKREASNGVWQLLLKIMCEIFSLFLPTAFQFSFGPVSRIGNEATDGISTLDIAVPVMISTNPPDSLLSAETIVTVTVTGGSATGRSI